ncbi:MAG: OmpA family protein [Nitrospirota bacterium]
MKKVFISILVLTFGIILIGCPPKKIVQPEPQQQPVVTPQETKEKAVELKPEERIPETKEIKAPVVTPQETREKTVEVKPEEKAIEAKPAEKVPEQQIVKIEPKEIEAQKYIEEKGVFEDIHFDFDRYDIRPDVKLTLKNVADWMLKNPAAKILIEGHCCEIGTNEYNLALGDRRAKATRDYLVALGVASGRIEMISYGEERPFCTESKAEECLKQNRRAHFVVQKKNK